MNTIRKLIAAVLALILTLASTALVFAPVAFAHQAPVVSVSQSWSSAPLHRTAGGQIAFNRE